MQQLKLALRDSTAHGIPRTVSSKPLYVRISWLFIFLTMLFLFLKGFSDFVVKLQSRQVTTSIDADSVKFQFPDVHMCFESPFSGSYSGNIDIKTAEAINASLSNTEVRMRQRLESMYTRDEEEIQRHLKRGSFLFPYSLHYSLMIDSLAHRLEQSMISANVLFVDDNGMPSISRADANEFYHPVFLRCFQWTINSTFQEKLLAIESWTGLSITLMLDTNHSGLTSSGVQVSQKVYIENNLIPLSDWSLTLKDFFSADRSAGVRIFLTPPREYPSDFVTSFSLGPGKHHTVEMEMTDQVYKVGQFDCVSDAPDVQFVNPYDQTPYSHAYSYSYCYYYEYHRQVQSIFNLSGINSPLPWKLFDRQYLYNLSEPYEFVNISQSSLELFSMISQNVQTACQSKKTCKNLQYSVSISSTAWPTQSSLAPFVNSSIRQAWSSAKAKNLSVPALDFLMTSNASSVTSYVRSNLLKVQLKPLRVLCDRVTFSKDYGFANFIADIGGIMGIYLGMSLMTLCELLELLYDLTMRWMSKLNVVKSIILETDHGNEKSEQDPVSLQGKGQVGDSGRT